MSLVFVFLFSCGGGNQKKPSSPFNDHLAPQTPPAKVTTTGIGAGVGGGGSGTFGYGEGEGNDVIVPWTDPETGITINIVEDEVIIVLATPEEFTRKQQDPPPNLDELDAQFLMDPTIVDLVNQGYVV